MILPLFEFNYTLVYMRTTREYLYVGFVIYSLVCICTYFTFVAKGERELVVYISYFMS